MPTLTVFELTTAVFRFLGLTRDSLALLALKWAAFIVFLAGLQKDVLVNTFSIPESWIPYIMLAGAFFSMSSAQHRTSGLLDDKGK